MAYGNYGAIVTKNGERCPDREDNTPYKEGDMQAGYHQAFLRSEGADPHHAVIGDGDIRLCAHKTYPSDIRPSGGMSCQEICQVRGLFVGCDKIDPAEFYAF